VHNITSITVLNTRPEHQSQHLTELITQKGGVVFNFPVMDIEPICFDTAETDNVDAIIFTSVNAVNYFSARLIEAGVLTIAVGPATQKALREKKCEAICPAQFNSEGILALPELQLIANKKIMIICGENSRLILKDELGRRGAHVTIIDVYRRKKIKYDMSAVFPKILSANVNVIVSTSFESLINLMEIFKNTVHREWLIQQPLIVINNKMKMTAEIIGFHKIIQADNATDEAIVAALCVLVN